MTKYTLCGQGYSNDETKQISRAAEGMTTKPSTPTGKISPFIVPYRIFSFCEN